MSKKNEYSFSSNTFQKLYISKMNFYDVTNWIFLKMLLSGQMKADLNVRNFQKLQTLCQYQHKWVQT